MCVFNFILFTNIFRIASESQKSIRDLHNYESQEFTLYNECGIKNNTHHVRTITPTFRRQKASTLASVKKSGRIRQHSKQHRLG